MMRVAVSGASGLIGMRLTQFLGSRGDEVVALTRRAQAVAGASTTVTWPGASPGTEWARTVGHLDAVVHLAGSPIAAGRWTAERKRAIRESRTLGTRNLIDGLADAGLTPEVFLSASAVGYYGLAGDERLTEESTAGSDFLAQVCKDWEEEARRAGTLLGSRVAHLRTGVVLAPEGGMLGRLLPVYRLGLGGPVGSGLQFLPWIAIDDVLGIVDFLLRRGGAGGPFNLTAPAPVRMRDFARALGAAVGRPARLRLPAGVVRLLFGEMGDATLLSGQRALPERLLASGYDFSHPDLPGALEALLPA